MEEPSVPPAPPGATPPDFVHHDSGRDRRRHRGRVPLFWDIIYAGLRKSAGHARSLYATVGIFLVAGALLAIAGTLAFAELGEWVHKGSTQAFDVAILRWLGAHHTPALTTMATELTPLGTGIVVLTIVGVSTLFLWHTEHRVSAQLLLTAVAGGIILNNALKLVFNRSRPDVFEWLTTASSSSFPSGHAMSATICYGTVAYLVARLQKHHWSRVLTLCVAALLIFLICLTRVYLGVHYPSDVIGGIVVGLAWSGFCMATLEASLVLARRRAPQTLKHEQPAPVESHAADAG